MEVKKIAEFSKEEVETLTAAGKILGALANAIAASEVDGLDVDSTNLIKALQEVIARV